MVSSNCLFLSVCVMNLYESKWKLIKTSNLVKIFALMHVTDTHFLDRKVTLQGQTDILPRGQRALMLATKATYFLVCCVNNYICAPIIFELIKSCNSWKNLHNHLAISGLPVHQILNLVEFVQITTQTLN